MQHPPTPQQASEVSSQQRSPEILVFADSKAWVWTFLQATLVKLRRQPLRLSAAYGFNDAWTRLRRSPYIIIHWECKERSGGAMIEELKALDPSWPWEERLIVLTTNPTHEDIFYLSELMVHKVIPLQQTPASLTKAEKELSHFLTPQPAKTPGEAGPFPTLSGLTKLPQASNRALVARLICQFQDALTQQGPQGGSAKILDLKACLAFLQNDPDGAEALWREALAKNPSYFRACHHLIHFLRLGGRHSEAFHWLKTLQQRNRGHITRMVAMGEVQVSLGNDEHAIHYFEAALAKDSHCSLALNGLAEVYFRSGNLDKSRGYLARSSCGALLAAQLNADGIQLVQEQRYEEALELYTKAQYVLPQQEKSPLLFYNIALCYSRWGKYAAARQFLEIALIKEPTYAKAQRLLATISGSDALE